MSAAICPRPAQSRVPGGTRRCKCRILGDREREGGIFTGTAADADRGRTFPGSIHLVPDTGKLTKGSIVSRPSHATNAAESIFALTQYFALYFARNGMQVRIFRPIKYRGDIARCYAIRSLKDLKNSKK